MTEDEQEVLDYLKSSPESFFSVREICRRACRKEKWEENPRWALPALDQLLMDKLVEVDANNHYRLIPEKEY